MRREGEGEDEEKQFKEVYIRADGDMVLICADGEDYEL